VTKSTESAIDPISVLVITPDRMTGESLKSAFAHAREDFVIETLTGSSQKIIDQLGAHKVQVALVSEDLEDGPQAGIKVLQALRDSYGVPAILLLQSGSAERVVNAFREGARGIFYRSHSLEALSKCIRMVHKGQIWASNEDVEHLVNALSDLRRVQISNVNGIRLLTEREEEVVHFIIDGLKNSEIAEKLDVKEHSVRNYIYRIFDKLGVSSRVELILYAFSQRQRRD
jgi:DNA-binding NarL/FixJ family response regulator